MSKDHILSDFQDALDQLRKDVITMASTAEHNLENAVKGLLERSSDLCGSAIADDEEVDQLEKRIDQEGMRVLALYNPVAADLRAVVAIMKMATNIERVSDEAVGLNPRYMTVAGDKLFGSGSSKLWVSDGTTGGTVSSVEVLDVRRGGEEDGPNWP